MIKVVFLDKDGTLIENIPYNVDPEKIKFCPGVPEGLKSLGESGYQFVIVSNQSGVARGYFSEQALLPVIERIQEMMDLAGTPLLDFTFCPHHPEGRVKEYSIDCPCRKPKPGMLLEAAQRYEIDLQNSWLIGDILDDVEAGKRAGCSTVLIDNGNETVWQMGSCRQPDFIALDFSQAANYILERDREKFI